MRRKFVFRFDTGQFHLRDLRGVVQPMCKLGQAIASREGPEISQNVQYPFSIHTTLARKR
ncbi:hypothetical protein IV417_12005 [Alphaproteobacteria bacterium KMM 3653]|uniref:Uncharacterized protein n=1 Tax=Harenicola maris TaxID=2841044 RepID=A0AAP2CRX7_9RHOB|nr:hypothetical protein [Harenicola maris]